MLDPLIILAALICGLISRALGLPALIGHLAARNPSRDEPVVPIRRARSLGAGLHDALERRQGHDSLSECDAARGSKRVPFDCDRTRARGEVSQRISGGRSRSVQGGYFDALM